MQLSLHGDAEIAALKETLGELFFVALLEVMRTEVMVFDAGTEHKVGRGQHRAGDSEDGLLGTAPALDAEELRALPKWSTTSILCPRTPSVIAARPGRSFSAVNTVRSAPNAAAACVDADAVACYTSHLR